MPTSNGEKMMFGKDCQLTLDILEVKIFTVSKITVFLHFMQNFKMATKTGGENNFWKEMPDDSNLGIKNFTEITLSFYIFCRISRWPTIWRENIFLAKNGI